MLLSFDTFCAHCTTHGALYCALYCTLLSRYVRLADPHDRCSSGARRSGSTSSTTNSVSTSGTSHEQGAASEASEAEDEWVWFSDQLFCMASAEEVQVCLGWHACIVTCVMIAGIIH